MSDDQQDGPSSPTVGAETKPRDGDVIERAYEGRAVKHFSSTGQRYLCLAYPCPNLADWFYRPAHSDLCQSCVDQRESALSNGEHSRGGDHG